MVDIAQLVSASDCGSEGRGFESHYPPHKKDTHPGVFFYGINGIRKSGPTIGRAKKCPVDTFLARGRIHGTQAAVPKGCRQVPFVIRFQSNESHYPLLFRWTVFRPWENP